MKRLKQQATQKCKNCGRALPVSRFYFFIRKNEYRVTCNGCMRKIFRLKAKAWEESLLNQKTAPLSSSNRPLEERLFYLRQSKQRVKESVLRKIKKMNRKKDNTN